MKFLLNLLLLMAGIAGTAVAADDEWTLKMLMRELSAINIIDASFVERKKADFLDEPFTIKGDLYFQAPHTLRKNVTDPYTEAIAIDETTIIVRRDRSSGSAKEVQFVEIDSHPTIRLLVESMRAVMAGDLKTMLSIYDSKLSGNSAQWNLEMKPLNKKIKKFIRTIHVSGEKNKIKVISMVETDDSEATMELSYNIIR